MKSLIVVAVIGLTTFGVFTMLEHNRMQLLALAAYVLCIFWLGVYIGFNTPHDS